MPHLTPATFRRLREAAAGRDGAALVGPDGRRQLAFVVATPALDAVRPDHEAQHGAALQPLLARPRPGRRGLRAATSTATSTPGRTSATCLPDAVLTHHSRRVLRPTRFWGHGGPVNLHDWIDELSDVLDVEAEVDEGLLADLTKVAAHNVEHMAAPVTAYLLGFAAATHSANPEQVERLAAKAQALAEGWDRPAAAPDPDDIDDEVPDDSLVDHTGDLYEV